MADGAIDHDRQGVTAARGPAERVHDVPSRCLCRSERDRLHHLAVDVDRGRSEAGSDRGDPSTAGLEPPGGASRMPDLPDCSTWRTIPARTPGSGRPGARLLPKCSTWRTVPHRMPGSGCPMAQSRPKRSRSRTVPAQAPQSRCPVALRRPGFAQRTIPTGHRRAALLRGSEPPVSFAGRARSTEIARPDSIAASPAPMDRGPSPNRGRDRSPSEHAAGPTNAPGSGRSVERGQPGAEHRWAIRGQDRLGMELDALDRVLAMADAHHQAIG